MSMGRTGMIPHDNRENPLSRVINKFDISGQAHQPSRRSRSKITAKPVYAVRDILMTSSRKTSSPARLERFHVVYKFLCFSCNLIKNKNKKQFSSRAPSPDQLPTSVSLPKSRRICVSIPVVAEIFSFFFVNRVCPSGSPVVSTDFPVLTQSIAGGRRRGRFGRFSK